MNLIIAPLLMVIYIVLIYRVNNSEEDINRTLNIYGVTLAVWSLGIFLLGFFMMLPYSDQQYVPTIFFFTYQFLLAFLLIIFSFLLKKYRAKLIFAATFILMFSFLLLFISLFHTGSGYDGFGMSLIYIFSPLTV